MFELIKTLFLVFFIGISAIFFACGWVILIANGWILYWAILLLILLLAIYNILKRKFWIYIWRSIFLGIFWYIFTNFIFGTIVYQLLVDLWFWRRGYMSNWSYSFGIFLTLVTIFVPLYFLVKILHFYRKKSQEETIVTWTILGDLSIIFGDIFRPFINFFRDIQKNPEETIQSNETTITEEKSVQTPKAPTVNSESTDLMNSLSQVDITNISGITFLPKAWKWFQVKTPNIKRLAVYISSKLWKTTFEVEELRNIYNHVVKNLQSNLSKTDYNIVQGKINEFVQSGGEVKIEKV